MSIFPPHQSCENIIPEDLSYLPDGDGPPSDESFSPRGHVRELVLPIIKSFFLLPVLKLAFWSSLAAALLLIVGYWTASPWLPLAGSLLPDWDKTVDLQAWTDQLQQWSEATRTHAQQVLNSVPSTESPAGAPNEAMQFPTNAPVLLNPDE